MSSHTHAPMLWSTNLGFHQPGHWNGQSSTGNRSNSPTLMSAGLPKELPCDTPPPRRPGFDVQRLVLAGWRRPRRCAPVWIADGESELEVGREAPQRGRCGAQGSVLNCSMTHLPAMLCRAHRVSQLPVQSAAACRASRCSQSRSGCTQGACSLWETPKASPGQSRAWR